MGLKSVILTGLLSLAGSFVVALASIWSVREDAKKERTLREERKKDEVRGFLLALKTEIESIWERYMDTHGNTIEDLEIGNLYKSYVLIDEEYFTVYQENSDLIGKVKDDEIREMIVKTYTQFKALADTLKINNRKLEKEGMKSIPDKKKRKGPLETEGTKELEGHFKVIKKDHEKAKYYKNILIELLDEVS